MSSKSDITYRPAYPPEPRSRDQHVRRDGSACDKATTTNTVTQHQLIPHAFTPAQSRRA
jgi:hypothetical protein